MAVRVTEAISEFVTLAERRDTTESLRLVLRTHPHLANAILDDTSPEAVILEKLLDRRRVFMVFLI